MRRETAACFLWLLAVGCSEETEVPTGPGAQPPASNVAGGAIPPNGVIPPSAAAPGTQFNPTGQAPVTSGQPAGTAGFSGGIPAGDVPMPGAPAGAGEAPVATPGTEGTVGTVGTVGAEGDGACATAGLTLEGLMYSPGGTTLPHPCEPYHPTLNNPYAVRCIDAWPWYKTQYPGDEFCILPPEPGKGIQIGVHPQGKDWYTQVSQQDLSGYENPTDEFLMTPGQEEERNYVTSTSNEAPIAFYRSNVRMRAGSHHMILSASGAGTHRREAWSLGSSAEGLFGGTNLPGAQRPDENVPKSLDKPEEDRGLYQSLGADQDVVFNMHHFNSTDSVILKEAWENLWFEEETDVRVVPMFGMPLTQAFSTFATPGQTVDIHASWNIREEMRLLQLFGHRHVWTTNFSAWVEKPDGSEEILYQSFDWFDQPTYRYDNVVQNPTPAPDKRLDGGTSGVRILKVGEELHFNCHMAFTDERASVENAPSPTSIGPLRFANQAFEGEMCILFGSTAGVSLGQPTPNNEPVPDFATVD